MDPATACAIGVMAKAPRPGRSKTRLARRISPDDAAALSAAFLRDVTENVRRAARETSIAAFAAYAPAGEETLFEGHLAHGTRMMLADGSPPMPPRIQGFGRCLMHALEALMERGFRAACLLNSDSPTLPTALLIEAARVLSNGGRRIVLGPADDGGYYLIGMTAPHAHLFEDIAWSTADVAATTRERARALKLQVVELATWYDVDDEPSLDRLILELSRRHGQHYPAPFTTACLSRLGLLRTPLEQAAQ